MDNPYSLLLELEDNELVLEMYDSILKEISQLHSEDELQKISDMKFHILAASAFDMEMQNGGLCQFLMNVGKVYAPLLPEALRAVGAERHAELFLSFCEKHNIDPSDLSDFSCVDIGLYMQMLAKYPFDSFDEAYYEIDREKPLYGMVAAYIRSNFPLLAPA